ncbi:MAG: tRNA dihydrouridine(20/20a) synthase DusA [Alphaproteobacteria bacterium]
MNERPAYRVSVAPMMDWTDRHCRYMLRLISHRALLYTEMVTTEAILCGDRERLLSYDQSEHPVALQLGGADPDALAVCAQIAADCGYDEINLNVGCPSDRVQSGRFGACLMLEPDRVARCIEAMANVVDIPVTVKSRIGVDNQDEWESLSALARVTREAGSVRHIVHARKAWLKGLNPKQNREIPPLRYDIVYRLKQAEPSLVVVMNGGLQSFCDIDLHLSEVDGVMLGRAIYQNPYLLAHVDGDYYGDNRPTVSRRDIVIGMIDYIERKIREGTPARSITRHMVGIFQGMPGARRWRRHLSEDVHQGQAVGAAIRYALDQIPPEIAVAAE